MNKTDLTNTANNVAPSNSTPMTLIFEGVETKGNLIDGDTVSFINPNTGKKESLRFGFGDAGETAKITSEGFSAGSYTGQTEFEQIDNLARTQGYNKIIVNDYDKTYGRYVGDLENSSGDRFAERLVVENIIKPSMFLDDKVQDKQYDLTLRSGVNKDYAFLRSAQKNLTPFQQANEIVQEALLDSPVMTRNLAQTSDQLIFGSRAYSNFLKRQLKDLKKVIENKNSTEEEIKAASEEYNTKKETLYINMNYDSPFYGSQEQIDNAVDNNINQPGVFGGWFNAGSRSLLNLESAAATFTEWSGDLVNNESWQQWGDNWEDSVNKKFNSVNTGVDLFDIKGPGDGFKWVTETAIEFAPQLAAIYAGTKTGAAVGAIVSGPGAPVGAAIGGIIGGVSTGFSLAVGQIYNSMPDGEKDPFQAGGLGLAVGLVDALGIRGGSSLLTKNVLTKDGKDYFIEFLQESGQAATEKEAQQMLKKGVAKVINDTGLTFKLLANKQLIQRQGLRSFIREGVKNGAREGVTEGIQEVIAQGGVAALTSEELDWTEFSKDIIRNAAAGSVVGSAFGVVGQSKVNTDNINVPTTLADINAIRAQSSPINDKTKRSKVSLSEEYQRNKYGEKLSVEKIAKLVNKEAIKKRTAGISQSAPPDSSTVKAGTKAFLKDPTSAFRAMANVTKKDIVDYAGKMNDNMQTYFGIVSKDFIFTGTNTPSEIDFRTAKVVQSLGPIRNLMSQVNVKTTKELDNKIKEFLNIGTNIVDSPNPFLSNKINQVNETIAGIVENSGVDVGITPQQIRENYLWGLSLFNPDKIDKDFVDAITGSYNSNLGLARVTAEQANQIANRIKNNAMTTNDLDAISNFGLNEDKAFTDKYLSNSVYPNVTKLAERIVKKTVMLERYGADGINLVYLLNQALLDKEITPERHRELLGYTKRLLEVYEGSFQRVDNRLVKAVNNTLIATTTLRLMDMNAFANIGEMFYGSINLSGKDKVKYLGKVTKAFLQGIVGDYYSVPTMLGAPYRPITAGDLNNKDLDRLYKSGHITTGSDVLEVEGVKTSSPTLQKAMRIFYMFNLVSAQNNAPRAAKMSFAWDSISKLLEKIRQDKLISDTFVSETGLWSRDRLNFYGLDPDKLIETIDRVGNVSEEDIFNPSNMSNSDRDFLSEQIRLAEINFTDEFTARPQPGSVPAIFESEVFAPYTQFKRFLAHITANMIPNLWNNYVKTAPPGTSFDTYSSIVMVVASAYAAQALKDLIAYGETPDWIEDEDDNFFRSGSYRAINYSGFMGTPELLLEEINDVFSKGVNAAQNGNNPLGAMVLEALSVAPSIGVLQSDIKAINAGGEKRNERLVGMIPFVGSLQTTKQPLIDLLDGSE